jgi:hypothetical protein
MRGRAYLGIWHHYEIRPGRIEYWMIDPVGMMPIDLKSIFTRYCHGPAPKDTVLGGIMDMWFWEDAAYFDSLEVKIVLKGSFWNSVPENDSCRIIEYGPFEWSTWVKVAVEK